MAEHAHTTGAARPLPLEIIDLDSHPDGSLLRMCAALIRLRETLDGACHTLGGIIARTPPRTAEGARMKELVA